MGFQFDTGQIMSADWHVQPEKVVKFACLHNNCGANDPIMLKNVINMTRDRMEHESVSGMRLAGGSEIERHDENMFLDQTVKKGICVTACLFILYFCSQ